MPARQPVRTPARPDGATRSDAGEWREPFLVALRGHGIVRDACKTAGVSRKTVYAHRRADPDFEQECRDAIDDAMDGIELALRARAMTKSDVAAIVLLKAYRPERYREEFKHEVRGHIKTTSTVDLTKLTGPQLELLENLLAATKPTPLA